MGDLKVAPPKKRRVKSGCVTCRVRKIKCDEIRPSCNKCSSTGRKCEGYGIWDRKAGNSIAAATRNTTPSSQRSSPEQIVPLALPPLDIAYDERDHLEWFRLRTSLRIPGLFISCFWNSLLIQACLSEDAVLHAVLAISSVHKAHTLAEAGDQSASRHIRIAEQRTLHHYIKAIRHLRPHLQANTKRSRRVALIVCIVLTSTDLLRGHFSTAKTHVGCGEKLLLEMDPSKNIQLHRTHDIDLTDTMIAAAFMRLRIQGKLLTFWSYNYSPPVQGSLELTRFKNIKFSSYNEAWQKLAKSINEAFTLTRNIHSANNTSIAPTQELIERRKMLKRYLEDWLHVHQSTAYNAEQHYCCSDHVVHGTLKAYHTMISIMVNVCLRADTEMAYDSQTGLFASLLQQFIALYQLTWGMGAPKHEQKSVHHFLMSRSIIDMGNIPLLYHTIIKCRVHRIRKQALRLLEVLNSREGFWDSNIMSRVASRTVEIEEHYLLQDQEINDDFHILDRVETEKLDLSYLPNLYRLHDVDFGLSGSPTDTIFLYCKRRNSDEKSCRVLVDLYDVKTEKWSRSISDIRSMLQSSGMT